MLFKLGMIDHQYDCELAWTGEKRGRLDVTGLPALEVATPPEFEGHAGIWTPEHLFVAAASACHMTTFLALAARGRLALAGYRSRARGHLTRRADGKLAITRIDLTPEIAVTRAGDEAQARDLCAKAEKHCLISNSMAAAVEVEPTVVVVKEPAPSA